MMRWSPETTRKFVKEYRLQECLWNFNLPSYKDRDMRELCYNKLAEAMKLPDFGATDARKKINNLRATFNQEKKKYEELGPNYKPPLKWFQEMEPVMKIKEKQKREDIDELDSMDENSDNDDPLLVAIAKVKTEKPLPIISNIPSKKKKTKEPVKVVQDQKYSHASISNTDIDEKDSFDVFGHSVAKQLRKLSEERALLAQSAIQNILTEYGIEDLREKRGCSSFNQ